MPARRFRARWILPITSPTIRDGEVVVEDDRILDVRPIPSDGRPVDDARDFGEAALMPGLVNVHTHLDYTVMRGLLEEMAFFPWVRELTARKAALEEADWIASATLGAAEAVAGGVTTVGDCTDSGAALMGARALGLRGTIYQEVFSVQEPPSAAGVLADARVKVAAMRWAAAGTRLRIGVSPHAPYTVQPTVLSAISEWAESENVPVCIHAAESRAESEALLAGRGEVAAMFARRGIGWLTPPPGLTTVKYLDSLGALGSRTLLVHGVQIAAGDVEIVRQRGCAWAHCPKSNAKLGNGIASLGLLRSSYPAGQERVGLGSDSVASNNTMDLFEEMRFALLAQRGRARRHDALTATHVLRMATIDGARALGIEREAGSLEPGKQADLIAVRLDGLAAIPCYDPCSTLVYSASARDVTMTMIGGQLVHDRGEFPESDLVPARDRFRIAAQKLKDWRPAA